jgi:hypothetical protein
VEAPAAAVPANTPLASAFLELAGLLKKSSEPNARFKGAAFAKAAAAIGQFPDPITAGKQLAKVGGVGKSSIAKVRHTHNTAPPGCCGWGCCGWGGMRCARASVCGLLRALCVCVPSAGACVPSRLPRGAGATRPERRVTLAPCRLTSSFRRASWLR